MQSIELNCALVFSLVLLPDSPLPAVVLSLSLLPDSPLSAVALSLSLLSGSPLLFVRVEPEGRGHNPSLSTVLHIHKGRGAPSCLQVHWWKICMRAVVAGTILP